MKKEGEKGKRGKGERGQAQTPLAVTTQHVRAFLAGISGAGASASLVEERFQVQTLKDRNRIRDILAALVRSGQAEIVMDEDRDEVRYALCPQSGARGSVQARLWRFACHRFQTARPFTAAEAAGMAECDKDYTRRYFLWLWHSAYLTIVSRIRTGAILYQVVSGKEHEPAPPWNRRAEKRKRRAGETPAPPDACATAPPAAPAAAGIIARDPAITFSRERLDAALEDFGLALVDIIGSVGRASKIIREMKGELLMIGEQGHDELGGPTEGHH
ncbi:MAG: hypothetical protein FJ121_13665 [Deltaproteobacteria bacterium]|nr:hypothetical protein [Deltaproteobacteria bacterium]